MKQGATFINTSRGDHVREGEMVEVLVRRPDPYVFLDVLSNNDLGTTPRLFELPNVVITPHIAGSMGPECRRMGRLVIDDLGRYLRGEPLEHMVTKERFALMA